MAAPQFAYAQAANPPAATTPSYVPDYTSGSGASQTSLNASPTSTTQPCVPIRDGSNCAGANTTQTTQPSSDPDACGFTNPTACFTAIIKFSLSATFGQFFALILQLAGFLFETSVYISIANFGIWISGTGSVITQAWEIIRDIVNILVIFFLLIISLQTIIGKGPELRKIIVSVVIFGLLTNFSLLFAKSLIDVSNIVALNFYAAAKGGTGNTLTPDFNNGVAARIMDNAHFSGWFSNNVAGTNVSASTLTATADKDSSGITSILLACIVMLVAAFVFFQMTFLLFGRAVYLLFAIILSPLMFAGPVLFKFEGQIKKWWNGFFEQLAAGPIFFILLWLVLYATKGIIDATFAFANSQHSTGITEAIQNNIVLIVAQIIAFGLMMAGLQMVLALTKQFSKGVGDTFIKYGSKAIGYGLGRPLGYLGRQAGGRLGRQMQKEGGAYQRLQEGLSKSGYSGARMVGNLLKGTSDVVKNSSYEVQNIGGTKVGKGVSQLLNVAAKIPGATNVAKGLDFGTAKTKGYEARIEDADNKITDAFKKENEKVTQSGARKYDKLDREVSYVDETGQFVTVQRGMKTASQWDDILKKANKYVDEQNKEGDKKFIETQRFDNLNPVDKLKARVTNVIQGGSSAADNRERAIKNIEKESDKKTKEEKNKKKNEEKLKAYEDKELATQLEEEGLLGEYKLSKEDLESGKHKSIGDTEEGLFEAWNKISSRKEDKFKAAEAEYNKVVKDTNLTGSDREKAVSESKVKLEKLRSEFHFAKNAKKEIEGLRKKLKTPKEDKKEGTPNDKKDGSKK